MIRIRRASRHDAAAIGRSATLQGWIRTRRDSKGGFSFLELNDGTTLANIQVVAEGAPGTEAFRVPMPPKGNGRFTDAQIRAVSAYAYSLARPGAQ